MPKRGAIQAARWLIAFVSVVVFIVLMWTGTWLVGAASLAPLERSLDDFEVGADLIYALAFLVSIVPSLFLTRWLVGARFVVRPNIKPCRSCGEKAEAAEKFCRGCQARVLAGVWFLSGGDWVKNILLLPFIWWIVVVFFPLLLQFVLPRPAGGISRVYWFVGWSVVGLLMGILNIWLNIRRQIKLDRKAFAEAQAKRGERCTCGYDLRGSVSGLCPECGREVGVRASG